MQTHRRIPYLALSVALACLGCWPLAARSNMLANPGFETEGPPSEPASWTVFNNGFRDTATPLDGVGVGKAFGDGPSSVSGLFQDFSAVPGQSWDAAVWVRSNSGDHVSGSSQAELKIEFYDPSFVFLGGAGAVILTPSDAADTWTLHEVLATAPTNTVLARYVVDFNQTGDVGGGATLFDDAAFNAPEPASGALVLASMAVLLRRRASVKRVVVQTVR